MYTLSSEPSTIDEVQLAIERWFKKRPDDPSAPFTFSRKSSDAELNVSISHSTGPELKVEMGERSVQFQIEQSRLDLNLRKFVIRSAFEGEKLCLKIEHAPKLENRALDSVLRQFSDAKHPAFCVRILRAVIDLDSDLTTALIDEATAAPTDKLAMIEALTSAPWVAELAAEDPVVAAKLRGFQLRQEMLQTAGGVLSSAKVAELLNLSRQAVDKRRAANQLLALTQGRRGYSYPSFQFADGATLTGLEEVLRELSALDAWMQLRFFTTPYERLNDRTPIDALRHGEVAEAVSAARGYGEQGAM